MDFKYGKLIMKSNDLMRDIESKSAQVVIGSPPYSGNMNQTSKNSKGCFLNLMKGVIFNGHQILSDSGVFINISTDERVNGSLWQKSNDIAFLAQELGFTLIDHIIWSRTKVSLFRVPFSHIMIFKKGKTITPSPSKELSRTFLEKIWHIPDSQIRKDSLGLKFTGALNPKVAELLISRYSKPGDLVVNPFVGSGTIIAQAESLRRKWIGYEINRDLLPLIKETMGRVVIKTSNTVE
ncbi:DNA methyltransferase [Allomuricauda sp. XS_ASV26]|uniref:DNA methyltransferase n=1 Tax=Allomuricauda sp. XS_ASV26 TaxID=3241292 RepID=UPI003514ADB8